MFCVARRRAAAHRTVAAARAPEASATHEPSAGERDDFGAGAAATTATFHLAGRHLTFHLGGQGLPSGSPGRNNSGWGFAREFNYRRSAALAQIDGAAAACGGAPTTPLAAGRGHFQCEAADPSADPSATMRPPPLAPQRRRRELTGAGSEGEGGERRSRLPAAAAAFVRSGAPPELWIRLTRELVAEAAAAAATAAEPVAAAATTASWPFAFARELSDFGREALLAEISLCELRLL